MPPALICQTGARFGSVIVVGVAPHRKAARRNHRQWALRCACGAEFSADVNCISAGRVTRCGSCARAASSGRRHGCASPARGKRASKEYEIWSGMKARCQNPNAKGYDRYGARGITVSAPWQMFANFLRDMGKRPSPLHTLERKDNSLGYCAENCTWATMAVQSRNKGSNRIVELRGERLCLTDLAARSPFSKAAIAHRLDRGMSPAEAIEAPSQMNMVVRADDKRLTHLEFNGVRQSTLEWEKQTGIPRKQIARRIRYGWSVADALSKPLCSGRSFAKRAC